MQTTNLLILIGHVGQDPKPVGSTVRLSVATNRSWRDPESGERKTVTDWVPVTCFAGRMADFVQSKVRKGDIVSVQAHVAESSYQKDGKPHFSTDVIADRVDLISSRASADGDE